MSESNVNESYVSNFPGIDETNAAEVFASAGYHEPQQKIPAAVIAVFIGSLLSLVPIFGSWISILSLIGSVGMLRKKNKNRHAQLPGYPLLRAALGVSILGLGIGFACILSMLIMNGLASS